MLGKLNPHQNTDNHQVTAYNKHFTRTLMYCTYHFMCTKTETSTPPDHTATIFIAARDLAWAGTIFLTIRDVSTTEVNHRNVNVPWPTKGMGDAEYIFAFQNLVMPIADEFNPDLVISQSTIDAIVILKGDFSLTTFSCGWFRCRCWRSTWRLLCDPCLLRSYDAYAYAPRWRQTDCLPRGDFNCSQLILDIMYLDILPGRLQSSINLKVSSGCDSNSDRRNARSSK